MGRRELPAKELTGQEEELEYSGITPLRDGAKGAHASDGLVQGREATEVVERKLSGDLPASLGFAICPR